MKPILAISLFVFCVACATPKKSMPQKHYAVIGKVVSVDAKEQSAAIDAAAIPGFMEAMTMDYPIQSKTDFASLHPGDHVTGTLEVSDDGSYTLSQIKIVPPAPK